jgi:hypothetical protein
VVWHAEMEKGVWCRYHSWGSYNSQSFIKLTSLGLILSHQYLQVVHKLFSHFLFSIMVS